MYNVMHICFLKFSQIKTLFDDPSGKIPIGIQNTTGNYASVHGQAKQGFTTEQQSHIQSLNIELCKLRGELNQLKVNNIAFMHY